MKKNDTEFRINKNIVRKIKIEDQGTDFANWQTRSYADRLRALEQIRQEYNSWKYADQQGFQRVYRIIKQK